MKNTRLGIAVLTKTPALISGVEALLPLLSVLEEQPDILIIDARGKDGHQILREQLQGAADRTIVVLLGVETSDETARAIEDALERAINVIALSAGHLPVELRARFPLQIHAPRALEVLRCAS